MVPLPNFVINSELLQEYDTPALYDTTSKTIVIGFDTALGLHGYSSKTLAASILLNHEWIHHIINILEGPEASETYDNIIFQLTDFEFNIPWLRIGEKVGLHAWPYAIPREVTAVE